MRAIEPWVEGPLLTFLDESAARITLLMTASGQVVAQHGFLRSLDVMAAAALGAGIMASTEALARLMSSTGFDALVQQGSRQGMFLAGFDTPRGRWVGLVVYGPETSVGIVQLFFERMVTALVSATPERQPPSTVLADNFEHELNASLRALFGR